MDWSKFLQDNSASLVGIGGVVLGVLLISLGSFLTNRFEARERDKDRKEKRWKAEVELAIELAKNDIKLIEDSVDGGLSAMGELMSIHFRLHVGEISVAQFEQEIKDLPRTVTNFLRATDRDMVAQKLAYDMGMHFYSKYTEFWKMYYAYCAMLRQRPSMGNEADTEVYAGTHENIVRSAGNLHRMLTERLIAIRQNGNIPKGYRD